MTNPRQKKMKKMTNPLPLIHPPSSSSPTTFSSVADENIVDCLARISKSHYSSLCLVSKRFYSLLSSPEIYEARSQIGATEPRLYVCMGFPDPPYYRWLTLSEMNGKSSFVPVKFVSSGPCPYSAANTVVVGSEIYQIGREVPSRDIHVLDCRTHTWRRGPNMIVVRKSVESWYLDGKIYVIGDKEYPMNWGEVLDLKTQTWKLLPLPRGEDKCSQIAVFGGRLHISFESENNYAYDSKEERWVRDDSRFQELEPRKFYPCWCLIDKILFGASYDDKYKWYNVHCKKWTSVCGLDDDLYRKRSYCSQVGYNYTDRLANYGGKLVVLWHTVGYVRRELIRKIWCTVISLEERLTPSGLEIWGKVERSNFVLQVPMSCLFLTCLSASV